MAQTKITKETFTFIEKEDSEVYALRINEGRFKRVIFSFGKVDLNEDKENDRCNVNFKFAVHQGNLRYSIDNLQDNRKFKDYLSKILIFILEEEYGQYDEHPAADIKENL